ncbi:MAG: hypothetical protein QOF46_3219 [Paraburkholderia sp.]|nr:hypothetical protein [Paraburkholderia sp.]
MKGDEAGPGHEAGHEARHEATRLAVALPRFRPASMRRPAVSTGLG